MLTRRILLIVVAVLAAALFAQTIAWAPRLPERVASHFDMSDRVNGWMGRTPFLLLTTSVELLVVGLFVAMPLLLERLPDALINVPHKEYWLAPERRAQSLAHLGAGLLAVGCATLLLLLVIFQGVFALNAELAQDAAPEPATLTLPVPFGVLMGLYLAAVGLATAWMLRRFRRPT